jgi:glycine hydroxymethyltransferase
VTSGLRLGTPALTSRGMNEPEIKVIADLIQKVLEHPDNEKIRRDTLSAVSDLCKIFPIYEFLDGEIMGVDGA